MRLTQQNIESERVTGPSRFICGIWRFDLRYQGLWRGDEPVRITPKAWEVLRYLIDRPQRLITRDELIAAVWGDVAVGDGSLAKVMSELRTTLGDQAKAPTFIETVHRRGFRFIAPLEPVASGDRPAEASSQHAPAPPVNPDPDPERLFVGRERDLRQLEAALQLALRGQRQIVFIGGEPGIGKTTLVDTFLRNAAGGPEKVWSTSGQCIDQYGPREAFMPVLEALARLCRQPGGSHIIDILRAHAPAWLAAIPGVIDDSERDELQRRPGLTVERMLRALVEALDVMTAREPLVLVLEDLHWADYSTLDLLAAVGRRPEPARLMVIATYRPAEAILHHHPVNDVRLALELNRQCRALSLELLSAAEVHEYLSRFFPGNRFPPELTTLLQRHTGGNPMFLRVLLEYLRTEGWVDRSSGEWSLTAAIDSLEPVVPDTLRVMIERQYDKLEEAERQVLDAASIANPHITTPAVAAALGRDEESVERICHQLAQRGTFLQPEGSVTWRDGTSALQFRFIHSLYQHSLYSHLLPTRRREWHRRIGERLEKGYGDRTAEIAAELALHFEVAQVPEKQVQYLEQAANNSMRRFADQEAIAYIERTLQAMASLPEEERTHRELALLLTLGGLQATTVGYGAQAAYDTYERVMKLCRGREQQPFVLPALGGLALFHLNKGELGRAQELGERVLSSAQTMPLPPEVLAYCRAPLVLALFYRGRIAEAAECLATGVSVCEPTEFSTGTHVWSDQGVSLLGQLAITLLLRGQADEAWRRHHQAMERARSLDHAGSLAQALCFGAVFRYFSRDVDGVNRLAIEAVQISEENGLRFWQAQARTMRGAAIAQLEDVDRGVALLRQAYEEMRVAGGVATGTYVHCMIAEALLKAGRLDEAESEVKAGLALSDATDERFAVPELLRVRGEILLSRAAKPPLRRARSARRGPDRPEQAAVDCLRQAIDLARSQGATWWELRSLVRLCAALEDEDELESARHQLTTVLASFVGDRSWPDLSEAAASVSDLS